MKIIEIPASLRLFVADNTPQSTIDALYNAAIASASATIEDGNITTPVKEHVAVSDPTLADVIIGADVWAKETKIQVTHELNEKNPETDICKMRDYAFSIADFGGDITVTQTGNKDSEFSPQGIASSQTVYWSNNDNHDADDLKGSFAIELGTDGLAINANIEGHDLPIENYDEVIKLTTKAFYLDVPY